MRRVVITGMGVLTPFGRGLDTNWQSLMQGKSGLGPISSFATTDDYVCRIAGEIPPALSFDDAVEPKEQRRMDRFVLYGMVAAADAVLDAGWTAPDEAGRARTGIMLGSGIGGIRSIEEAGRTVRDAGPRRLSPFFIPSAIANILSGYVSIRFGFTGPNLSLVSACATGAHAIGESLHIIRRGDADVMVAGGAESAVCETAISGFAQMKALSTHYNATPEKASRPWDKGRDGFVMGEGAGALVLEEYEHAMARGARIYAEVAGYGLSGDAHHITAPATDGHGAVAAMKGALALAGMNADDIDYINAHGTSTPVGDLAELSAVRSLFGQSPSLSMSSTKSSIGHLLGAAGAVEAIYCAQAIGAQTVPATLNLTDPDEAAAGFDLVPLTPKKRRVRAAMSNSFGFGGTNATLIIKAV
ncbi:3-oxoacyl-[acyl-carrier-protein] synthase 2 [Alphaproteobacteria bacterium]|nr:3-oxoacyl-[acyl-carrier-protein] synthase 2 [Alphaproteobacteria bacterium]